MVQESKIINPRSILVPLRGKKLGNTVERQEDKRGYSILILLFLFILAIPLFTT
jgi:hypothetical protein